MPQLLGTKSICPDVRREYGLAPTNTLFINTKVCTSILVGQYMGLTFSVWCLACHHCSANLISMYLITLDPNTCKSIDQYIFILCYKVMWTLVLILFSSSVFSILSSTQKLIYSSTSFNININVNVRGTNSIVLSVDLVPHLLVNDTMMMSVFSC